MTAPAAPTGLLVTAGYGCVQAQWKAPLSSTAVPPPLSYIVTTSSTGPAGTGSSIPDGNTIEGSTAWSWLEAPSATGWVPSTTYPALGTITVTGNVWLTLLGLTAGSGAQPAGLSATSPAPGTTVTDSGGTWLIVPPWFGGWAVTLSSVALANGQVYTCTKAGTTFAPVVITLVVPTAPFKPPVVLTVGGLDNAQQYAISLVATNSDGASPSSATVMATPNDFGDGLFNTLSYLTGEVSNDFVSRLGKNPPVMWIGPQYLTNRDDGQRIVFVPKGGPIVGGSLLGNDQFYSSTANGGVPAQPRQIWAAMEEVEAHVWGLQLPDTDAMRDTIASYAQARSIASYLLATLHRVTIASDIALSAAYPGGRDKTSRGAAMVVKFNLNVPVVRYTGQTGVVAGFTTSTTI